MGCISSKGVSASERNNTGNSYESILKKALKVSELQLEEHENVFMYIYMNWYDIQKNSSLIEALRNTKFVANADGDFCKPKDLFDPNDPLLRLLFGGEPHKFPGEKFVSDGWLSILRKTGLQNTRDDADTVLQCARRIEFLGGQNTKDTEVRDQVSLEIWSLAEALIETIFENSALLHDRGFCSEFGKIACVPADQNFSLKTGKKCFKRVLCSYNQAVLLKDWSLAWTAAPILSNECLVPPNYSWGALQLRSPPPFTIVLKHLQANTWLIEPSLCTIERVSLEVLKYLDQIWETLSSTDVLELKRLALIVADNGTRLATPASLFACLNVNLSPLASQLPSTYLPFLKILKELGVEDMLSISSAINILSNLHKSCGSYLLNPNELHAVINILEFLCNETIDLQTSDKPSWESELVVPDDGCRLVRSNMCVYIEPHGSKYMNMIDSSKLRFVHHNISETLCLAFGIRKLSDVVVEVLDYVENLQTREEVGSVSLAAIKLKLLSRAFQVAVSSVVNNFSSITSGSTNPDFHTLKRSLESVAKNLKFVKRIYTRFWLLPEFLDITCTSNRSSHRTLYYVDRSCTCMLIAERPNYVSVVDLVALVVSQVLGSAVPLPIGSLLLCPHNSETALVSILKLSSDERAIEGVSRGNGFLGRNLLPIDEKKVRLDNYITPFCKGEIVVWQSQNGEKLKYGRVAEDPIKNLPEGKYPNKVKLETFPGMTETVSTSNVFHFRYWK